MSKYDLLKNNIKKSTLLAFERILIDKVIDATPVKTGHTAGSWEIEMRGDSFYLVNTNGLIAKYLEEGTKPHIIRPKNKKALRFQFKGKEIFAKEVKHPGFEGRFFVKKILDDASMWKEINDFIASRFTPPDK